MGEKVNTDIEVEKRFGFDMAPIGLVVTRERIIVRCNARFGQMFGYETNLLEGQLLSMLYPTNKEFLEIGRLGRVQMQTTGRYSDERIMKRANGDLFWCRARGQSQDAAKPFAHCVWSFVDLSDSRPMLPLTRRERQVAMMLSQGLTTKVIAAKLGLSPRTIEIYRSKLLRKFEAKNVLELLAKLSGMPI